MSDDTPNTPPGSIEPVRPPDVPEGIARIGDATLRDRAIEALEAARFLVHAIALWDLWLLKATPENLLHMGNPPKLKGLLTIPRA